MTEAERLRVRGVSPLVQQAAKDLRQRETRAEEVLWQALRGQKLDGLKFRRQYPLGQFVLDFCCPACRLVVELDGSVHDGREREDAARTEHLAAYGYRVIRFRNDQVFTALPDVLEVITAAAKKS